MDTPDAVSRAISQVVSHSLRAAGISQRDAALRTGIPLTTLSRRLTGASPLLVTELAALARLLDTTVSDLTSAAEAVAA